MRLKAKSAKAFIVSLVLHLIAGTIGFFYWYNPKSGVEREAIETILMVAKKPETKRITRPKRAQVQRRQTTSTSQAQLKILTSEAPATSRGIVSAAEPTKFDPLATVDLGDGSDLSTKVKLSHGMPKIERVIKNPGKKKKPVEAPPKSRLVKFIERQQGPQRLIYCVDVSSSMVGLNPRKLQKIIAILQDSLTFLEPHDRFNLMTFSDTITFYQRDFFAQSDASISQANAYLDTVKPTKSRSYTDKDMLEALSEAQKADPTIVVLFSDGILTSGLPNPEQLKQHVDKNTRIFTMAIEMAEGFPGAVMLGILAKSSDGEFWLVDGNR